MGPAFFFVLVSSLLFCVGVTCGLILRNTLVVLMSVELMLNSANLALVAFAHARQDVTGQLLVFFVIVVAAAEVAVGLALLVTIFRTKQTTNIDDINVLKG